jgi:hypothetical protein
MTRAKTCRMTGGTAPAPRFRRLNLPQSPNATLDIRQLENGLERHGARSRPTTPPLASLAGIDALTGELRHGILGTISASTETENTRQYGGGVWLGNQDSNHDARSQSPIKAFVFIELFSKRREKVANDRACRHPPKSELAHAYTLRL